MLAGSLAVAGLGGRIRNRGFVIDDAGRVAARYDKIHLFDVTLSATEAYRESAAVAPGDRAVVCDMPLARLGLSICYDLRFPQLYRALARAGAEILTVPAAFTRTTGEAHWHVLNRARAIETGAFVVAPCAVGPVPGGGESYGHSLVVDPWGEVLADGGTEPGVVMTEIDLDRVGEARRRIPSLGHDRPYRLETAAGRAVA
jgi:predicted amidohydrolase